jgi:hypothetical protein
MIMGIALLLGTLAWTGWAYLNTAAAPHRFEDVATAVLNDPEARAEIAAPLADQIVEQTGVDRSFLPQIRDAVTGAMADPAVSANVTAAFGSVHARAVGVDDPRPATIDGAALIAAVRAQLATVDPALAAQLPELTIGDLHLPEYHPPFVESLRRVAVTCTAWLAFVAIALLALALIVGDRKYVMRRFGVWAVVTGAVWAIGPRILIEVVHRMVPDADATLAAAIGAATKMVMTVATVLVALGIGSIVAAQFVGLQLVPEPRDGLAVERRTTRRQSAAPAPVRQQVVPPAARPAYHVDTWTPSTQPMPAPAPATTAMATSAPPLPTRSQPPARPPAPDIVIRPAGWGVDQFTGADRLFGPPTAKNPGPDVAAAADQAVDPWAYFSEPPKASTGNVED